MVIASLRRPRIKALYLGAIGVVPRTDFRTIDQSGVFSRLDPIPALESEIRDIFQLPPVSAAGNPSKTDIGLDVVVADFRAGAALDLRFAALAIPVFWRPKIELKARLFRLSDSETIATASATAKMSGGQFMRRLLNPAAVLGLRPAATEADLIHLTREASLSLLETIRRKTR